MPRPTQPTEFEELLRLDDEAPSLDDCIEHALNLARQSNDHGRALLRFLIDSGRNGRSTLRDVRSMQEKLKQLVTAVEQHPWHPAIFVRRLSGAGLLRAHVSCGGQSRVVGFHPEVDPETVRGGDEVYLSKELNLIMMRSPHGLPAYGETAYFERMAGGGRCVLRFRDDEVVAQMSDLLTGLDLVRGDQVRWDRNAWMALERIERAEGQEYFLDDLENLDENAVGGHGDVLEQIVTALTTILVHPGLAGDYGVDGRTSILMEGPPGCGKTLMAKVAASRIRALSGRRCRFAVVKPGEWVDPYVGMTERNIRNSFKALTEASRDSYAVLFLDEIESIGRIRGGSFHQHADTALACLLAELNGFRGRGNVAVIAATNRKDLLDPALLERLGEIDVHVPRPDMAAAREIFALHLPEERPYAEPRRDLVEAALAGFFSPNAASDLATLRFRNGTSRVVRAAEMLSGRIIGQICIRAARRALNREVRTGDRGMRVEDIQEALTDAIRRLATTLSPQNAHAYLADLPHDADVIAVDPLARRVSKPHRLLRLAVGA